MTSHCARAEALSAPSIFALEPRRARRIFAVSAARFVSREPMTICSPAAAQRAASPEPSGPVPPRIPIFLLMVHPSPLMAGVAHERARVDWGRACRWKAPGAKNAEAPLPPHAKGEQLTI